MEKTLLETTAQLHHALRDYIEATYHISNPRLIQQRRKLLNQPEVIKQIPYLESTLRYKTDISFSQIKDLEPSVLELFLELSTDSRGPVLIHDPPYRHQAEAIKKSLIENKNLVVMTGTGSGKTESFLLPILGSLATEASKFPSTFAECNAVRAFVLYPMNALVNDQLGRLRLLFGDNRLRQKFMDWAGRAPRFARYTSRTPYAGVRDAKKDQQKLKSLGEYHVKIEDEAFDPSSPEHEKANELFLELKRRGKWPAKPNLRAWYGTPNSRWKNSRTGEFKRAVTLADDSELITRHEVHESPPDILVTNYSMLEYMLMRPIERPIFDQTKVWLDAHPENKIFLVLDEAHLYRGAAGAEVGLLIRRLRERLQITSDQMQVICSTASFSDSNYASQFGGQLTGCDFKTFVPITGEIQYRQEARSGTDEEAKALSKISLFEFYQAEDEENRILVINEFLKYRNTKPNGELEQVLYHALHEFPPMNLLINKTMEGACRFDTLGKVIFPDTDLDIANSALTNLMAFGSIARQKPTEPGLLPCRVHNFFRGLAGIWACLDQDCSELSSNEKNGPTGKIYSQPRDLCACGARVLELYTCRNCGAAYARAYTDDIDDPRFLWSEPGHKLRLLSGDVTELLPIDLLLENPVVAGIVEPIDYDLETGRLNMSGNRVRPLYVRKREMTGGDDGENESNNGREFKPCGICGTTAAFGRTSVQDHQTKGDQPFQALISKQIQVQPPELVKATKFAPLRGRKVLAFSDSRQVAARLAPNLQMYSIQDSIRPLMVWGFRRFLEYESLKEDISLEDLYLSILIAANVLGVRLRPELRPEESFTAERIVEEKIGKGVLDNEVELLRLINRFKSESPPEFLMGCFHKTIFDRHLGLEPLALGSIVERGEHTEFFENLNDITGIAETPKSKVGLARAWLRCWKENIWLSRMPHAWWQNRVKGHSGDFKPFNRILGNSQAKSQFRRDWLPQLLSRLTEQPARNVNRLKGSELSISFDNNWVSCQICRSVHRPIQGLDFCIDCQSPNPKIIDPETDEVFVARKGYYRAGTMAVLSDDIESPMALIAAEHTAQLNAPQNEDVFSKAEENELLFQDVDLTWKHMDSSSSAIDILSSTTTMEVGIDIGTLSGVALRNMPPGRANYQQRSGRAGRRGKAVATVVGFCSSDSHDEHYFNSPDQMIRGQVLDPKLTLDNPDIAGRHLTAFLLQSYHQERLPDISPDEQPQLFAVLGKVSDFLKRQSILNRYDFENWLQSNEEILRERASGWIPKELSEENKNLLINNLVSNTLSHIDKSIGFNAQNPQSSGEEGQDEQASESDIPETQETQAESGEEIPDQDQLHENLLNRLLYNGVLPRYAFPTDVASFHVFDRNRSTAYRPIFQFAPSQGLPIALTQYAPGKEVWISGKCYRSGSIYSPMASDRYDAWSNKRFYYECSECGFAKTYLISEGEKEEYLDCSACGGNATFGPGRYWLRPPGFAHPINQDEIVSPDDTPETSYATRAKLTIPTPSESPNWIRINDQIRVLNIREHLLVSNSGPRKEGYAYCTLCGLIEPTASPNLTVFAPHPKPFPDREPDCSGSRASRGIILGTDFITDVLLISLKVIPPLNLRPGYYSTNVALRTLSEALAKSASEFLELESGELMAEFRPALTPTGWRGLEAEIFLYDTLPGGAGFSRQISEYKDTVFQSALKILQNCPGDCDRSCYRCLRSFKNKFEHQLLDRHIAANLLNYLLMGEMPNFDSERINQSTKILYQDLLRMAGDNLNIQEQATIAISGLGNFEVPILVEKPSQEQFVVYLHGPLTVDYPPNEEIRTLQEYSSLTVLPVDELLVRENLPQATSQLLQELGVS
ncbi:DEAD/DEAH box helicase [Candidatus Nitromaritima sp. SCGC AAA799-C22]|nr:DEAD/DEAH box helicase [Candidatus Nitromaritima sp. SCGC AAA799-C22]